MKIKSMFFDLQKSSKYKSFIILCIPLLLTLIFEYISNVHYVNQYRSTLVSVYTNELTNFLNSTEEEFSRLIINTEFLLSISDFKNVTETDLPVSKLNRSDLQTTQSALQTINISSEALNNVTMVNRSSGFVVSTNGIYDAALYFNNIYKYDAYDLDFWMNYNTGNGTARYLHPTRVQYSDNDNTYPIIPLVFPVTGAKGSNIVIFNINIQHIYEKFLTYKFTENSLLYMIDSESGEPVSNSYKKAVPPNLVLANKLSETNYYYIGDIRDHGKKFFIISSQPRSNIYGYTYVAEIPYSDIKHHIYKDLMGILLLGVFLLFLLLLYAYLYSAKLFKPWKSIAYKLSTSANSNTTNKDIITYVNSAVGNLLNTNNQLKHDLTVSLSYSQQKYLIDILNNPQINPDDDMNRILFQYDFFVAVAINISLKQMPNNNAITLDMQLYAEVYRAIESVFASKFLTFSLPSTENALYLLLNVESEDCENELASAIEHIRCLFTADLDNIDLFVGIGNIYQGIDGLRQSHKEALANIFNAMNQDKIQMLDSLVLNNYSSQLHNENTLVNYMLTGHDDDAAKFIKNIFKTCKKDLPTTRAHTYASIFNALIKVIKIKKICVLDFELKSEADLLSDITAYSDEGVLAYLLDLIENISNLERSSGTNKLSDAVAYIQQHYTEDLYLDALAQKFNTTPKYLSRFLKQQLGTTFKTYLTQLRISKAEEILVSGNTKVTDIGTLVGFTTHSSFIRAFKQKNGISPSEYRSLYTK